MTASGRRQDHYEVLGVNPDAPDEVVRAAYRVLAAKHHPDRNPSDADAELKLKRLNAAFRVVGDSAMRKQYDELTRGAEAEPEPSAKSDGDSAPSPPPRSEATNGLDQDGSTPKRQGVIFKILKLCAYLALVLVVLTGAGIWYGINKDNESSAEQSAVTVNATYDPAACTQERPIQIAITNGSKRTLKTVSFALHAFENGRSDDLALNSEDMESNAIVLSGETSKRCWKLPALKRYTSVFFQAEKSYRGATFYEPNEFVPRTDTTN